LLIAVPVSPLIPKYFNVSFELQLFVVSGTHNAGAGAVVKESIAQPVADPLELRGAIYQ
jgi:hypothetical protein